MSASFVGGSDGFVPSSPEASEDDGDVLAFVHHPDRGGVDQARTESGSPLL